MMFKIEYQYRNQFWVWCHNNDILCEYMGTDSDTIGYDTWYIGNERDRTLAILRWS
jgi:hypothetical protein